MDVAGVLADVVDESVLQCLVRGEPAVAVTVLIDLLDRFAGLRGRDLGKTLLHREDELRLCLDVAGSAAEAAVRLVQEHAGVRRDVALALGAAREQKLPHRGGHA
ncbi:hypothetical protein ABE10_02845, partial [Bacillus toyonensis]|nr:hypothetical protein [Bacillus toyonensis]